MDMKSNSTHDIPLSPQSLQQKENDLSSPQNEATHSYVKVNHQPKMRSRQTQNVLSPLKPIFNHTTFSNQSRCNEFNQSVATFRKKKTSGNPKVSNYSEDLDLMMESYFSKKLKEIKSSIAQLNTQKETKTEFQKLNNDPRFFSPKIKNDHKKPISVINKAKQSDPLDLSNGMGKKKESISNGNKSKASNKLQKNYKDTKPKENHLKNNNVNNNNYTERKKSIQDKINQNDFNKNKNKKITTAAKTKNEKFNGAKFQYFRNDNCIHTVALDKISLKNMENVNKSLQVFLKYVFKKEVNVNVTFKNILQPNDQCTSLRYIKDKIQDESPKQIATMPNEQKVHNLLNTPSLQDKEKEANKHNLTEPTLLENYQPTSLIHNNQDIQVNTQVESIQEIEKSENEININSNNDPLPNKEITTDQESNKINIENKGLDTDNEPAMRQFEEEISKYDKNDEEMIQNIQEEAEKETESQKETEAQH